MSLNCANSYSTNPLMAPSSLPFECFDFRVIKFEHFEPAIRAGMTAQLKEVDEIILNCQPPTFNNVIAALERSGSLYDRASNVFFNLAGTDSTEEIRALEDALAADMAKHHDDIYLNRGLFSKVECLYNSRSTLSLSSEELRLLEQYHRDFIRSGAKLSENEQSRLRELNEEHSSLTTKFSSMLVAMEEKEFVLIDDVSELVGLSETEIQSCQEAATTRGYEGKYILSLVNTSRHPLLSSLSNRTTRQKLFEASVQRGQAETTNTSHIVERLVKLRAERAQLLGYETFSHYRLAKEMAKTPQAALNLLTTMCRPVMENVQKEKESILQIMSKDLNIPLEKVTVQPWDWEYYSEKVKNEKFSIDENLIKPYFEFEQVLQECVFKTMNRLFNISFRERFDLPVYHADVRTFDMVDDTTNQTFAIFFADYFKRKGKHGGAWMNTFVNQSKLLDKKPVIINVMNIVKNPQQGGKTLCTADEVSTMLHELGHGLHGAFSQVQFPSFSGTNTSTDFVEFPSTVHEDWSLHPNVLSHYAKHFETKEILPQDTVLKILKAKHHNAGFDTLEYLAAALIDLEWHSLTKDQVYSLFETHKEKTIDVFEKEVLAKYQIAEVCVPPRYKSRYFSHSMTSYASTYYAYMYSEILAADAHAYMVQQNGPNREIGNKFRHEILSRGNSRDTMESYVKFRGQEPTTDGLLERRGIANKNKN